MTEISKRLRHLRIDILGLTVRQFAEEYRIKPATVSRIETGTLALSRVQAQKIRDAACLNGHTAESEYWEDVLDQLTAKDNLLQSGLVHAAHNAEAALSELRHLEGETERVRKIAKVVKALQALVFSAES